MRQKMLVSPYSRVSYGDEKSESESHSVVSDSFQPHKWNSLGQTTG